MVVWRVFEHDDPRRRALAAAPPEELRRQLERLFEEPPSPLRDGTIAFVYLNLARRLEGDEAERCFVAGYSYARTSRDPQARPLAERVREEFPAWRR
ncbi:hypothetical protein Ocepr_1674 [Oceanithermus profundus DSM 14977]|uniref:Uncharacterized protein n=1 Tax=Oceanithermus profundus (strain DSM 14977 / NBRC 100410 / VKM B-2274 / 506) TaxID=670487 RepID=E4U4R0_OCEP5|nr:hypothetical protein Ocepr_1674 [Oceanithermus profundus DSM 14977]